MIYNLQLLRGLCALGVVIYHTHFQFVVGISSDFYGVAIFFAISGFIITEVTRLESSGFLLKRFVRVVPLYWLTTIIFFVLASFGIFNILYTIPTWISLAKSGAVHLQGFLVSQMYATFTADAGRHLIESFLFLPVTRPPFIGVGWTLNYEIFFYLVFAVSLAISRRWAPLLTIVFLVGLKVWSWFAQCEGPCAFYAAGSTWFFVIGILIHYCWATVREASAQFPRLVGLSTWIVGIIWIGVSVAWLRPPTSVTVLVVAGVLTCALAAEASGLVCRNRFLLALGDASYSLYLTHLMVIETMRVIGSQITWLDQSKSLSVMLASVAMSIGLAFVVHYNVEKPLLSVLRRWTSGRSPKEAVGNV